MDWRFDNKWSDIIRLLTLPNSLLNYDSPAWRRTFSCLLHGAKLLIFNLSTCQKTDRIII